MKASDLISRRIERKAEIRDFVSVPLFGIEEAYGINVSDGDLICVAGPPKAGKSTMVMNWCRQLAGLGYKITIATTESVTTAEKYAVGLLTLDVASKMLDEEMVETSMSAEILDSILLHDDPCELCHNNTGNDRLWDIIEESLEEFAVYDIDIYGSSSDDGNMTRANNLFKLMREVEVPSVFILDQINQVFLDGGPEANTPQGAAILVMQNIAQIIKEKKLAMIVASQVSTTSEREGRATPLGGNLIVAEANLVVVPLRDGNRLTLTSPRGFSRKTPPFTSIYDLEPTSGLLISGQLT
jgi:hypothetical protein